MSRSVFVLRIKPGQVDRVPEALQAGELFIGWGDVPQLLDPEWTGDDFAHALGRCYYPDAASMRQAASAARNTWNFIRELKQGDVVLVPHDKHFYVAEVAGHPTHRDDFHGFPGFSRRATWLNNQRPFVKDDFPDVRALLLERPTMYPVGLESSPGVSDFIDKVLAEASIADDMAELHERKGLTPTSRKALVEARAGQGRYREEVLALWGNACAVTGCDVLCAVRASHALPWRSSTDEERLDANNGLPLLANLDALFDAALIAFNDAGEMLVSSQVPSDYHKVLGIPRSLRRKPSPQQVHFLRKHRANFKR